MGVLPANVLLAWYGASGGETCVCAQPEIFHLALVHLKLIEVLKSVVPDNQANDAFARTQLLQARSGMHSIYSMHIHATVPGVAERL